MAQKNRTMVGMPQSVSTELFRISKELSKIEGRSVSKGEVVRRILKAPDIKERLKQGSVERGVSRNAK
ncbi:MAG: hypothetical protein ABEI74_04725 [Candidatus Pacearchaeota archaeon]